MSGTLYLVLTQVISRGLTFAGNQALLRYVAPSHLGLSVQLEALSVSTLYTARESLRVALQRSPSRQSQSKQAVASTSQAAVNAAYFVIVLGAVLGSLFSLIYLNSPNSEQLEAPDFELAFWFYGVATVLELLSEPSFVIIQQNALFAVRARTETLAAISRCVSAVVTTLYMSRKGRQMSVLPFAVGQLCYGLSLFVSYNMQAGKVATKNMFSQLPQKLDQTHTLFGYVPEPLLKLAGAFYGQSIFKWLLTQGDTLFLSYVADLQSQGIFALASNYGGLASRLLFQPVEESSRTTFGNILTHANGPPTSGRVIKTPQAVNARKAALDHLAMIVRSYIIVIAMPGMTLLPQLLPLAVQVLLGSRSQFNSDRTSALLSAYSFYLPTLAINGILDAFVTSVASETELLDQSVAMAGVTILYLSTAVGFMTKLGLAEVGLVYANILNMTLRIAFSLWFIRAWTQQQIPEIKPKVFKEFRANSLPSRSCLATFILVVVGMQARGTVKQSFVTSDAQSRLLDSPISVLKLDYFDLAYLATGGFVLVSSILGLERDFLLGALEPVLPQRMRSMLGMHEKAIRENEEVKKE